jgi:hypothetical protein
MSSGWTSEQILALAPDASSAKSGRDLAAARKWVRLGRAEGVLWGECQGSGASPYQTKIDLSKPAYNCSCPSRKFPCKHSLGLFLLSVEQTAALTEGPVPEWVTSWLEGRSQRADKKVEKAKEKQEKKERGEPTVDAEAKTKRESARLSRVAAGLDELGLWISDLVRQGLAATQGRRADFWDERARRMVDAQSPGVARRLLRIDALPTSGENWQLPILEHLSRLHLLIEGHRRIEMLPPETRADVRALIGYPIDLDEVRVQPGVRDAWRVIGQRVVPDVQDPRLRIQRTWLTGRDTGRSALILDFAHGTQALDTSLLPGSLIDADLAFFTSAAPLRGLIKEQREVLERTGTVTGHSTVASAYSAFADALAANPWLELYPLVLVNVFVQERNGTWLVRDGAGGVLPLSSRFARGWHVMAASGGSPVTLAAELDGEELDPLSFWVGGDFRPLVSADPDPRASRSLPIEIPSDVAPSWQETTASALVGVERRPLSPVSGDDPLNRVLRSLESVEPATRLLGAAAATTLYGRVGRTPPSDATPLPEAAGEDEQAACGPGPAQRLKGMLQGQHLDVLEEWLTLLRQSGKRLPEESLADVLTLARQRSELRDAVRPVLGRRGRWLAALNREWGYIGASAEEAEPDSVWQTGTRPERLVALQAVRRIDPKQGRELLASTWTKEPADERAAFVEALQIGLGPADEPFLEAALDDRGKTVRRAAALLLMRLDDSRFAARMSARARSCVSWGGAALKVEPPKECDKAMIRDGVEPKPERGLGERAWWLRQILSATPLSTWSDQEPSQYVQAAKPSEWASELWIGWAEAAIRERHARWITALLEGIDADVPWVEARLYRLIAALSPEVRESYLLTALRQEAGALNADKPILKVLRATDSPLGPDLGREVLSRLRLVFTPGSGLTDRNYVSGLWSFLGSLGRLLPTELLVDAESGWLTEHDAWLTLGPLVEQMIETLRFRREMHQELSL